MTKYFLLLTILTIAIFTSCTKSEEKPNECGADKTASTIITGSELFNQPSEIYWGASTTTRSYTYNFTFGNICTKKNPKVDFVASVSPDNNTLSNPFTFTAATLTCFGVQAHQAPMIDDVSSGLFLSDDSEIGMNQCFGGQASATIYPYIIISFATLGSSAADSLYLISHIDIIKANISYSEPK